MSTEQAYVQTEMDRRLANLIRLGTVEQANYETQRIRVRSGDQLTHWIPWLTRRAGQDRDWWAPDMGEQVLVLSPSGDPGQAVAVGAIYQDACPAPADSPDIRRTLYEDGSEVTHNRATHHMEIRCVGTLAVQAIGPITVVSAEKVTVQAPKIELN